MMLRRRFFFFFYIQQCNTDIKYSANFLLIFKILGSHVYNKIKTETVKIRSHKKLT